MLPNKTKTSAQMLLYLLIVLFIQVACVTMLITRLVIPGYLKFIDLCYIVASLTGVKLFVSPNGSLYNETKCFYFFNHRGIYVSFAGSSLIVCVDFFFRLFLTGWSDFFMDPIAVVGSQHLSALSRMFVYWV